MTWGFGPNSTTRTTVKQYISHAYQVWLPHVACSLLTGSKQAHALSLAAPSFAPGGWAVGRSLVPDGQQFPVSHSQAGSVHSRPSAMANRAESPADAGASDNNNPAASAKHVVTLASIHGDLDTHDNCNSQFTPRVLVEESCSGRQGTSPHVALSSSDAALLCIRPQADRTVEASTSGSSGADPSVKELSNHRRRRARRRSSAADKSAVDSSRHSPRKERYTSNKSSCSDNHSSVRAGATKIKVPGGSGGLRDACQTYSAADSAANTSHSHGKAAAGGSADKRISTALNAVSGDAANQPLTLERLREQTPDLTAVQLSVLQQRMGTLGKFLHLDDSASLMLCRAVPGVLCLEAAVMRRSWTRLCAVLGGEEAARGACISAPLLLVLPSTRVPTCIAFLVTAAALTRRQAVALVSEWPQLATHAPASLEAKLEGLRNVLGGGASSAAAALPATLRSALRSAPRLLTFSTAALTRHHAELSVLLGPERLTAAVRREPGLLLLSPATVATKLALLQQLMDCTQHPAAVAALVVRKPSLLRRSLTALSGGCRALSIWQLRRRDKLRMCLSRPGLLTLPPAEVHGRCRWLRRLVLSNAYFHSALRRLPPSLLGVVVAALPQAWSRLQYLAESSQEGRMHLMDAVECRDGEFSDRFPEYPRWLEFKFKLMGADNPWRGTHRIRGFDRVDLPDKPISGAPSQFMLQQRHQQRQRSLQLYFQPQEQQQQAAQGPSVSVVLVEAGEVRSGQSTVSRPRRVLQQPQPPSHPEATPLSASEATPLSASEEPPSCSLYTLQEEEPAIAPADTLLSAMVALPSVCLEVEVEVPPPYQPVAVRRWLREAGSDEDVAGDGDMVKPAVAPVAAKTGVSVVGELPW